MTSIERVADQLAITELLYRYAELIDAGDFDGVGQLLARCTVGGPGSPTITGAAAIAQLYATTTRRYPGPAGGVGTHAPAIWCSTRSSTSPTGWPVHGQPFAWYKAPTQCRCNRWSSAATTTPSNATRRGGFRDPPHGCRVPRGHLRALADRPAPVRQPLIVGQSSGRVFVVRCTVAPTPRRRPAPDRLGGPPGAHGRVPGPLPACAR